MKRKFLLFGLIILIGLACTFGFTACGDKTEDLHTHHLEYHATTQPSCTENGYGEYWYCAKCGKYFSDADGKTEISIDSITISATGHNYTETIVEPTCSAKGYTLYTCK